MRPPMLAPQLEGAADIHFALSSCVTYSAASIPAEPDLTKKPRDVVNELLRAGERAVLGSTSKSMKSWMVAALGVSKAAGRPWLDGDPLHTAPPGSPMTAMTAGRVLHVDLELMNYFLEDRVREICRAMQIEKPAGLDLWPLRQVKPRPTMAQLVNEIKTRCAPGTYDLVVCEPSYKLVIPTEAGTNSEAMVGIYLEALDEIACHLGAAVLTTHHSPKGNLSARSSIDLFSGTGTWARDPDCLLTLRNHKEPGHAILNITRRHGAPVAPIVLRWEWPLWHVAAEMDPTAVAKPGEQKIIACDRLVELLAGAPAAGWSDTEWRMAAGRPHIGKTTFYKLKPEAVKGGLVEVLGDGGRGTRYRIKTQNDLPL